jgi:hypothetical protein
MKSLDLFKSILLFGLLVILGYIAAIYHLEKYQPVTVRDQLYLVNKRTGETFYPAQVQGQVKWQQWVPALDGRE